MGDRVASFTINVGGDDTDITTFLNNLKGKFQSVISDLEATTRRVTLFEGLETKTKASADALAAATAKASELADELAQVQQSGGKANDDLVRGLKLAQTEVAKATTEYNRNVDSLTKMQGSLARAGVDTGNLAATQAKLAEQTKNAVNAAANQAAQQLLGLKTVRDTTPEVQRLYAAYNTLSVQGGLTAKELAIAHTLLTAKVAETKAGVSGLGTASADAGIDLVGMFTKSILPAIGFTATIAGVIKIVGDVIGASRDFEQGLAKISTVTNLTKDQLDGLGRGARDLATEIGIDLNDALKGLYDLIRSGVPPSQALEVLKVSAEAAKAALTDTGTGVKAAQLLISAYGASVADLGGDFDILVSAQARGGATLKEFADSAGPLLNVARAAGIGLQDLIATLGVMVNASGDAQQSIGDLQKIITRLGEPGTRAGLRELGIDTSTLVSTFQGIAASGKTVDQVLALGVASTKSAASVAALTSNADALAPSLKAAGDAAGFVTEKTKELYDSPKERSDRFNAALHETAVTFGELFGSGSKVQDVVTLLIAGFNKANEELADRFNPGAKEAKERLDAMTEASKGATKASQEHTAAIAQERAELLRLATDIDKQIKTIQQATATDISDLNARAEVQIAALDKTKAAELKTATDTLAIRTKLANDTFVVLANNEAKVTEATAAAVAARTKLGKDAGQTDADFAAAIAKIKIEAVAQELAAYQNFYKTLQDQENAYLAKAEAIAAQRIAFNEDVEQKLTAIRNVGLSSFDQYLATIKRIDELISLERQAATNGDIELAKKYADQAIALSGTIKTATSVNGAQIVSSLDVQTTAIGKITTAQNILNGAFDAQAAAAKAGAEATKEQMLSVADTIKDLQHQYDELKKTVAEGLRLRVNIDEDSIAKATAKLDDLAKERVAVIKVKVEGSGGATGSFDFSGTTGSFRAGGFVGASPLARAVRNLSAIQSYARGGPVFAEPMWSKVPGSGDGDTVPAKLRIGSFVMRKAASQFYGDGPMSRLVRGFASGGPVGGWDGTPEGVTGAVLHDGLGEIQTALQFFLKSMGTNIKANTSGGSGNSDKSLLDGFTEVMTALQSYMKLREIVGSSGPVPGGVPRGHFDGTNVDNNVLWDGLGEVMVALQTIIRGEGLPAFVGSFGGVSVDGDGALSGGDDGFLSGTGQTSLPTILDAMTDIMSALQSLIHGKGFATGGFVGGFADGGVVANILSGSPLAQRLLGGGFGARILGIGDETGDQAALRNIKFAAEDLVASFFAKGSGIPDPGPGGLESGGLNYFQYLKNVLALIEASSDPGQAQTLFDSIDKIKDSIFAAIEQAQLFHVPLVFGTNAVFDADFLQTVDQLRAKIKPDTVLTDLGLDPLLFLAQQAAARKKRGFPGFAEGGGVDTVDAMLTPGEFVLQPKAVSNALRLFGGGFLDALNNLKVPKGWLDNLMNISPPPPPLAFAGGGLVPGGPSVSVSSEGSGIGNTTVNIYTQSLTEQELNKTVLPWLDRKLKKAT